MAKKQTIILTHGKLAPQIAINKGEVLVQHAEFAKDAALWTVLDDGTTKVSFPSKAYVDAISETITGENGINKKIEGLDGRLGTAEGEIDALQAADTTIRGEFAAADTAIRGEFAAEDEAIRGEFADADTELETAYKAADTVLEGKITAEATARENADTQIRTDFAAADNTVRGEFAAADDIVRGEFAAADTALKAELNDKIETKADTTIVNGIDERLTKLIGNDADKSVRAIANEEVDAFKNLLYGEGTADVIDTLQDVINWIDSDESGATKIVADIAELQKVTSGYEGEKAIQNAVNGINDRLTTAEGEIDDLQAADTAIRGEFAAADTQIRTDFADADKALKNELTAEINKKADSTTVTGINTRLEAVEGAYVKNVEVTSSSTNKITANIASNKLTLDFDSMVIDGGEY